jgi:hypothetical protein
MTSLRAILAQSAHSRRPGARFVLREPRFQQLREALAYGLLNAGFEIERVSKGYTPVHGDPAQGGPYATFAPGARPIGGTLRRSQHTVAYLDGRRIAGAERDENGATVPDHDQQGAIVAVVGTNVEYAGYVHDGTTRMAARPFLARAMAETSDQVPGLIAAGARRHLGMRGGGSTYRPRDARGRFIATRRA